jgi:hypothetical protein
MDEGANLRAADGTCSSLLGDIDLDTFHGCAEMALGVLGITHCTEDHLVVKDAIFPNLGKVLRSRQGHLFCLCFPDRRVSID